MTSAVVRPSPVPVPAELRIHPGPALLAGVAEGPSLAAHRQRYGDLPSLDAAGLHAAVARVGLRGRGGAAFPFATKLDAVTGRRRSVVVVNLSEGEPASAKDSALALARPHLVLDGAVAAANALDTREVHLVLPGDRPATRRRIQDAVAERDDRVRFHRHTADPRFVSGQSRAVVELLSGRPNLPVTSWAPEAVDGLRGRPTLLSNAETWAQVAQLVLLGEAAYRRQGTVVEPGTALLTFTGPGRLTEVREVPYGTRMRDVLPAWARRAPALVGGFHGAWASWETLASLRVSVPGMRLLGVPLGAGVVHVPDPGACPLAVTAAVVDYLAGQSAGRCGPCRNGLPALASAVGAVVHGHGGAERVEQLAGLVAGRGACAHPDGTARLVRSVFAALPDEVAAHARGRCVVDRRGEGPARELAS